MSIYSYRCVKCGHEEDFFFKMGEAPSDFVSARRPDTHMHHFIRVFTSSALHLNGSSGDGYLFDSKTGLRSKGRRFREV